MYSTSLTVDLTVVVSPSEGIIQREHISYICEISSPLTPVISWYHNQNPIPELKSTNTSSFSITTSSQGQVTRSELMVMSGLDVTDSGVVMCVASIKCTDDEFGVPFNKSVSNTASLTVIGMSSL